MKYNSGLADVTMLDCERLWRVMKCLDAVDDAIAATSLQGKPAIRALLTAAYGEAQAIMRKAAKRAIKLGTAGAYGRKVIDPELIQRLAELAKGTVEVEEPVDGMVRTELE